MKLYVKKKIEDLKLSSNNREYLNKHYIEFKYSSVNNKMDKKLQNLM